MSDNVYHTKEEQMGEISFEEGEECRECGQRIKPDSTTRMCHTCRTRPHRDLVDELAEAAIDAADTREQALSIAFEVRSEVFERAE